ncbi:hypothetical protein BDN71DRAFT_1448758 [Pleurotus eryngii]|uniref:Transcription factor Iwr1 domain-containing protein n=1 Tax=Pleurotus eryngii TaxID=5323 RepID=A0A9P6D6G4_PLEER|nr:hypothetical protein BDN71DRAFT_1448758 [Pleurotus eryngii]
MTIRPAGLDRHLKTHPSHASELLTSEDEVPIAPVGATPRRKTGAKGVPMSKPKRATSADASKVNERHIAPLPSRVRVPIPSQRAQGPAVPRVGAKPAVRRPKQRLTRRQYHRYVFFDSSGDEEVSAGSSTEDEGEHKTGLVEYDADDSDNEADTYERELNENEDDVQSSDEDESEEGGVYAYTHPISYTAYGSASEDSADSGDTALSSSSSHLAQPARLPVELISVPQPHPDTCRSLESISHGMYGSSSSDDSDDGSSSSSSPSSSLAKPVNASQDATGMDVDTDDESLDPVYAATSSFYMPCSA